MAHSSVDVSSSIKAVSISASLDVERAVHVVFGDRPKALEDGSQGDHTIAYSLYETWLVNTINRCIATCGNDASDPRWIELLAKEMQMKLREEEKLLQECGLGGLEKTAYEVEFHKFLEEANALNEAFTKDKEIIFLTAHKERVLSDSEIPLQFRDMYTDVGKYKEEQGKFLDDKIVQRKIVLGASVAENAAVAFLKAINANPLHSFRPVPGWPRRSGKEKGALNILEENNNLLGKSRRREHALPSAAKDNQIEKGIAGASSNFSGDDASTAIGSVYSDGGRRASSRATTQTQVMNIQAPPKSEQIIANEVAEAIINLLDFIKLNSNDGRGSNQANTLVAQLLP